MDMSTVFVYLAVLSSFILGGFLVYLWVTREPRPQPKQEPVTRVMEAVKPPEQEQPTEKTLLERQVDKIFQEKGWH
jgi:hypothetical protein